MSNNIYTILGKLKGINDAAALTPESQEPTTVYETVEAQGSILEAVRSMEAKYKVFGEGHELNNKQDFDAHAKVGDYYTTSSGNKVTKTETGIKHEKVYAADKSDKDDLDEGQINEYSDAEHAQAMADFKARGGKVQQVPAGSAKNPISTASRHISGVGDAGRGKSTGHAAKSSPVGKPVVTAEGTEQGLSDATAKGLLDGSIDIYSAQGYGEGVSQQEQQCLQDMYDDVARDHGLHSDDDFEQIHQHMLDRIEQDYSVVDESNDTDDNVDYEEFYKDQPADPDTSAISKRKRIQAIKDRQEEQDDIYGKETNTSIRKIAGKAYGGAAQKDSLEADDLDESSAQIGDTVECPDGITGKIVADLGNKWLVKDLHAETEDDELEFNKSDCLAEVAPPGAKAERMVKHIKKGYADDGKLTKREKGIAYATAWKAHNKGQVEEGCKFGDPIKNSAPNMKKAKLSKLKEGRVMEDTDYFYEKVAKALAEKNTMLDTAGDEFVDAVRKEMVAQGIEPNRARNILLMDEDFLGDVATSYGHYCKEVAECSAPINSHLGGVSELDEIAALAGLTIPAAPAVPAAPIVDEVAIIDEEAEIAEAASRKDFRMVANLLKNIPDSVKRRELAKHHADIFKQQNPRFSHNKFYAAADALDEGNEFTKARLDAIAQGNDTFNVGDKTYKVTGDSPLNEDVTVNVSANGDQDVINLIARLAGIPGMEMPTPDGIAILQNQPQQVEQEYCDACDSTECHCGDLEEERDIELANTPHEQTAPVSAVTTDAGGGIGGPKKQYRKEYPGDNPMAVKEESLWDDYQDLIDEVKAQ